MTPTPRAKKSGSFRQIYWNGLFLGIRTAKQLAKNFRACKFSETANEIKKLILESKEK